MIPVRTPVLLFMPLFLPDAVVETGKLPQFAAGQNRLDAMQKLPFRSMKTPYPSASPAQRGQLIAFVRRQLEVERGAHRLEVLRRPGATTTAVMRPTAAVRGVVT
jgi:hypothetical protein